MRNPFLCALILLFLPTTLTAADFIADVASADCTKTRLSLDFFSTQVQPSLAVRLTPTRTSGQTVLTSATRTGDGRYLSPVLVMPFAEYRVEAIDPGTQQVIGRDVLDTALIVTVLARKSLRTPVQVRREPRLADTPRPAGTVHIQPNYDRGASRLHIILVNDAGVFLDQYFGKPVPLWESRPISAFNVYALGAQYYPNGTCRAIPLRSAD